MQSATSEIDKHRRSKQAVQLYNGSLTRWTGSGAVFKDKAKRVIAVILGSRPDQHFTFTHNIQTKRRRRRRRRSLAALALRLLSRSSSSSSSRRSRLASRVFFIDKRFWKHSPNNRFVSGGVFIVFSSSNSKRVHVDRHVRVAQAQPPSFRCQKLHSVSLSFARCTPNLTPGFPTRIMRARGFLLLSLSNKSST